jgi:hypothetical protein
MTIRITQNCAKYLHNYFHSKERIILLFNVSSDFIGTHHIFLLLNTFLLFRNIFQLLTFNKL